MPFESPCESIRSLRSARLRSPLRVHSIVVVEGITVARTPRGRFWTDWTRFPARFNDRVVRIGGQHSYGQERLMRAFAILGLITPDDSMKHIEAIRTKRINESRSDDLRDLHILLDRLGFFCTPKTDSSAKSA
jgi:hypothetical protein